MGDDPAPPAPNYTQVVTQMPAPPNPSAQASETLQWNLENAPKVLASRQEFDPQFAQLQTDIQKQTAEAGTQNYLDLFTRYGDQIAEANKSFALKADPLGAQRNEFILEQLAGGPNDQEAAQGYRDLLSGPMQDRSLLDQIRDRASSDLALGSNLSADQQTALEDQMRTAQSSRGLALGPSSAYQEVLRKMQFGEELANQRFTRAGAAQTLLTNADQFNISARANLLRSLGTENLQGPASKATFLGLSAPPRLGETSGAFGAGYSPQNTASPFSNSFLGIDQTAKIYGDIGNFNARSMESQANYAASTYGDYTRGYNSLQTSTGGYLNAASGFMPSMFGT